MASTVGQGVSSSAVGRDRYSAVAMVLHWLLALAITVAIVLGWRMDGPPGPQSFALYQLHKSVGITVLLLTVVRIGWRLRKPPPPLPVTLTRAERLAAHGVHAGLYVLLVGLPLTGWLLVSTSARTIPTILFGTIPWPHVPGTAALSAATRETVSASAEFGHESLVKLAYLLVALHVAGALKHQFVDRSNHFRRMFPVARRTGVALIATISMLAAAGAATWTFRPAMAPQAAELPAAVDQPAALSGAAPVADLPLDNAAGAAPEPMAVANEAQEAPAVASRWRVDSAASEIGFATSYSGTPVSGSFASWTADIRFAPDALDTSSVRVSIDLASLKTASSDAASMLPDADWFSTAAFPRAIFIADRFRALGGDRYEASGRLTLRGQSHPQTLRFSLRIRGNVATVSGTTAIDRTRFGVGQGEWGSTAALAADVPVTVRLTATRQP